LLPLHPDNDKSSEHDWLGLTWAKIFKRKKDDEICNVLVIGKQQINQSGKKSIAVDES
jgi:hypothetical protein